MVYSNVLYIVAKNLEISSLRSVMRFFGPWSNLMLEELKYYVEHDQPHPRKLKAQQKQLKKTSAYP